MQTGDRFGILLAGGFARRMGGGDKALRKAGGNSLLAHVIAALRPQCEGLVLSANGDPARFAGFDLPIVADNVPGFKGPLAGILAGLDWIAAHCRDVLTAISMPADTPFLPSDLAARLMDARVQNNALIACARSGGRTHSAVALWPVAIRNDLRRALVVEDIRKVEAFSQNYSRAVVDWPIEPFDPFFNANDPSDLAAVEAILSRRDRRLREGAISGRCGAPEQWGARWVNRPRRRDTPPKRHAVRFTCCRRFVMMAVFPAARWSGQP